jgi:cell division septum initiation protein DivIVA
MSDREKELVTENENLKQEINKLKDQIEKYREMEVDLSTTIDLLREGAIK